MYLDLDLDPERDTSSISQSSTNMDQDEDDSIDMPNSSDPFLNMREKYISKDNFCIPVNENLEGF